MINIEKEAEIILSDVDTCGSIKRCSLDQWIDLLELLSCELEGRYQAAKEDRKRREGAL